MDISEIAAEVRAEREVLEAVRNELRKKIVGQDRLLDRLLIGLISNSHLLIEGVPGLAKTLAVTSLSKVICSSFHRIQFTPDLLPADLIGTLVYHPGTGEFSTKKGPIFSNIVLADEINRAPAKVQSALLEAMQERQVTIGDVTHVLDDPFMVLATQNPIEQEGTYPLPEAQVDRFMLKVLVGYPNREEELAILRRVGRSGASESVEGILQPADFARLRAIADRIFLDEKVEEYIVDLIRSTRDPDAFGLEIGNFIEYGASPRATIFLTLAARAHALLQGRGFVTPQDVKTMAPDVLRHRVVVTYEAEAEERTSDDLLTLILNSLPVP